LLLVVLGLACCVAGGATVLFLLRPEPGVTEEKMDYNKWAVALADAIAATLLEFRPRVANRLECFAVDCAPWNGNVFLGLLTQDEGEADQGLREPTRMAEWKFYAFTDSLVAWTPATELASRMRPVYERAENRPLVVEQFLQACAKAVATRVVQKALSQYELSPTFRISIPHPDTNKEYYAPSEKEPHE
jgi:hypothetical protein